MPKNKELNEKLKDERREQILSTALMLFASRGLAATRITDISKAANISQGLLYHYFSSKEEIFVKLMETAFEKLNEACRWLEAQPMPPDEKIRFAIYELLKLLEENPNAARYHLLIAQSAASDSIPDEAKDIIRREYTYPYEVIARIITEGQEAGTIKKHDANQSALVFWSAIKGLAIYRAVHQDTFIATNPEILCSIFLEDIKKDML